MADRKIPAEPAFGPEDSTREPSSSATSSRALPPAAERALAEAKARRAAQETDVARPKEQGGPQGPDPVRYGDWERKGIASDF